MRGGGICWDMSSTCIQGGLLRPLGGYQPNLIMEPHSPASAWQMNHPIVPKQEPMDEDCNDSGINSGSSDFHSSSPGSENGQGCNPPSYSSMTTQPSLSTTYNPNMQQQGCNPLTPSYETSTSPQSTNFRRSPSLTNTPENSVLSPKTTSEHSENDENKSEGDVDEFDEQGIRVPKVNSHGKVKTFKCKQCDFVAVTKLEFWEHSKAHIKADKLLTCPKCPFVTEYKHHLEYHLRNHFGSKPFKCDKCPYSCVNKSMLNSHMKSHSNIYQYRCADCSYATKYCHSLKLHLRKYNHKPAMVLNPDGTPNPLPIIDVYGTRRGPKQKPMQKTEEPENNPTSILQNQFAHFMLNASPQMQLPFPYPFLGGFTNPLSNPLLFKQNMERLSSEREESASLTREESEISDDNQTNTSVPTSSPIQQDDTGALDLSKPDSISSDQPIKNRRKGRAYKLERLPAGNDSSEEDEENVLKIDEDYEHQKTPASAVDEAINNNKPGNFCCQYCNIVFGDIILYTMHMGYHGFKNPFTCNMCGEECNDKVSFFLHIARNPHT